MTREELKRHCEKQVESCEQWAKYAGEEPHGKVYEEHKLILELLEQEPFMNKPCIANQVCHEDKVKVLDRIRTEIEQIAKDYDKFNDYRRVRGLWIALDIIDKYKAESEDKE